MSRFAIFLFIALLVAVAVAFPANDLQPQAQGLQRIIRAVPMRIMLNRVKRGFGYRGYGGGYGGYHGYGHRQYGGCGGRCGGYPSHGGRSYANSGAHSGSINTPLGSASFANAFANSGSRGYGR